MSETPKGFDAKLACELAPVVFFDISRNGYQYSRTQLAEFQVAAGTWGDGIYAGRTRQALLHILGEAPASLFKPEASPSAAYPFAEWVVPRSATWRQDRDVQALLAASLRSALGKAELVFAPSAIHLVRSTLERLFPAGAHERAIVDAAKREERDRIRSEHFHRYLCHLSAHYTAWLVASHGEEARQDMYTPQHLSFAPGEAMGSTRGPCTVHNLTGELMRVVFDDDGHTMYLLPSGPT